MAFAIVLSDEQSELVADLFDPPGRRGAPALIPRRQMVDAMLFIGRTGIQWRYLPERYGAWTAVWAQWRRWRASGVWAAAMTRLVAVVRWFHEREPTSPPLASCCASGSTRARRPPPGRGWRSLRSATSPGARSLDRLGQVPERTVPSWRPGCAARALIGGIPCLRTRSSAGSVSRRSRTRGGPRRRPKPRPPAGPPRPGHRLRPAVGAAGSLPVARRSARRSARGT